MSGKHATVYKTFSHTSHPGATGLRGATGHTEEPGFTPRSALLSSTMSFEINGCDWVNTPNLQKENGPGRVGKTLGFNCPFSCWRPQDNPLGCQVLKLSFSVWAVVLNLQDPRQC